MTLREKIMNTIAKRDFRDSAKTAVILSLILEIIEKAKPKEYDLQSRPFDERQYDVGEVIEENVKGWFRGVSDYHTALMEKLK